MRREQQQSNSPCSLDGGGLGDARAAGLDASLAVGRLDRRLLLFLAKRREHGAGRRPAVRVRRWRGPQRPNAGRARGHMVARDGDFFYLKLRIIYANL